MTYSRERCPLFLSILILCSMVTIQAQAPPPKVDNAQVLSANGGVVGSVSPLSVTLGRANAIAIDTKSNLYIADGATNEVYEIDSSGKLTVIAGNGKAGYSGDNGPAVDASLNGPTSIAVDDKGTLFIADSNNMVVREVDTAGTIKTVAGTIPDNSPPTQFVGDGGSATKAHLSFPVSIALDRQGNLYIADDFNQRIRKVDASGTITTIAGTGERGYAGDNGYASSAKLSYPSGVAVDDFGNIYIADFGNFRIREFTAGGLIRTIVGNGTSGFSGDSSAAINAQIQSPSLHYS